MGHSVLGNKRENIEKKSMSSSPFIDKIHKHYKTETKSPSSSVKSENCEAEMAATNNTTREDERGFMKTENFVAMDPREANFQETVKLVEILVQMVFNSSTQLNQGRKINLTLSSLLLIFKRLTNLHVQPLVANYL